MAIGTYCIVNERSQIMTKESSVPIIGGLKPGERISFYSTGDYEDKTKRPFQEEIHWEGCVAMIETKTWISVGGYVHHFKVYGVDPEKVGQLIDRVDTMLHGVVIIPAKEIGLGQSLLPHLKTFAQRVFYLWRWLVFDKQTVI